jgi:hypothetical protein
VATDFELMVLLYPGAFQTGDSFSVPEKFGDKDQVLAMRLRPRALAA